MENINEYINNLQITSSQKHNLRRVINDILKRDIDIIYFDVSREGKECEAHFWLLYTFNSKTIEYRMEMQLFKTLHKKKNNVFFSNLGLNFKIKRKLCFMSYNNFIKFIDKCQKIKLKNNV